jgi:hypothetical protein
VGRVSSFEFGVSREDATLETRISKLATSLD